MMFSASVSREQVIAALELAREALEASAHSSGWVPAPKTRG